jgi:hypothetical protein
MARVIPHRSADYPPDVTERADVAQNRGGVPVDRGRTGPQDRSATG